MTTNCRPLTLEEQSKLQLEMRRKHISQTRIAISNNFTTPVFINKVCNGLYNITPKVKEQFKNAGINLDKIMGGKC